MHVLARTSTKWLIVFAAILCVFAFIRPLVFAEDGSRPPQTITTNQTKDKLERKLPNTRTDASEAALKRKNEIEDRLASGSAGRDDKLKAVGKSWEQMDRRLKDAIAKEENLIGRLEKRITEAKTKGVDTSAADAKLVDAKAKLAKIKTDLASLEAKASTITGSTDPKAAITGLLADIQTIKKQLIELHKVLQSILPYIQEGQKDASRSARPSKPPKASSESAGVHE